MNIKTIRAIVCALTLAAGVAGAEVQEVRIAPGEHWWGVCNSFGTDMPFTAATSGFKADIAALNYGGQPASLMLSDRGRVIHSAAQSQVTIDGGVIRMSAKDAVTLEQGGDSLPAAFRFASAKYFPPSGKSPDPLFFSAPQYNTWMELTYNQNETDILAYAQSMLDHGLPPGVLMIDDTWQTNYGVWDFDPKKFRDPKGMTDRLHAMGFKVLVWVIPFVSLDSQPYRDLTQHGRTYNPGKGGFIVNAKTGAPAHISWWNGYSALLDLTDPVGDGWFRAQLNRLRNDYGVDGFKFDGGQFQYYAPTNWVTHKPRATCAEQNRAYAAYGEEFPTSEHRCVWGMAGRPVMVRLPDKGNTWEEVRRLVPDMFTAGLIGYPFICPDMIGGGSWTAYLPGSKTPYDKELFIRSAQVHALCPMMQFSVSPWRLMKDDPDGQKIICDLVALRQKFAPRFVKLAEECGRTGEPMIRNLEYVFPNRGYAAVNDQFMMGDFLLVAPQLEKGATSRPVAIPPGTWRADDGSTVVGPKTVVVETPLARLPYFERVDSLLVSAACGDMTSVIQGAIDKAFLAGGGRVTLASGIHSVRSIRLRSGVELYLKSGAHLQGSRNPADYDGLIVADAVEPFDGERCAVSDKLASSSTNHWNNAILRIYGAHDVSIVGEPGSVIDGQNCYDAKGEEKFRGPHGISVHFSTNVVFCGYELRDAGNWSHRICLSADVVVRNVRVRGGHDGLDFHACDRVTVTDCDLQTGDDCVAGYDIRNLTVRNCRLNTACSAFRIGGRDILVDDVTVTAPAAYCHRRSLPEEAKIAGTNPPGQGRRTTLSFFTYYGTPQARGRSGNIVFRRCRVVGGERFMHYNFSGGEWWQSGQPLEDVTFEDVAAEGVKLPLCAYAPADCPLKVSFVNCRIAFGAPVAEFAKGANVETVSAEGLSVEGVEGPFFRTWGGEPEYRVRDVKGVEMKTEKADAPFKVKPV